MKIMAHARFKRFLKEKELYPEVVFGFHRGCSSGNNIMDLGSSNHQERAGHRFRAATFLDVNTAFTAI